MEINPHTPIGKTMSGKPALTADEQKINNLWEEHLRTEFDAHSARCTPSSSRARGSHELYNLRLPLTVDG